MPRYELALILKVMERPELIETIKRTSMAVINSGAIIRSMENIGYRKLPHKVFKHGRRFDDGNYFLIHFESPITPLRPLMEELRLDTDIIRPRLLRAEEITSRPCDDRPCDFGELTEENRARLFQDLKSYVRKL